MQTVKHILVPVDFSECSDAALEWAGALALRFSAEIDVLHVCSFSAFEFWTPYPMEGINPHLLQREREEAAGTMEKIVASLEDKGIFARARVETGDPLKTILRVAAEGMHDVIVMGTHGRTGVSHFLLGSVAESVVRKAGCPVLTIRQHEIKERRSEQAEALG